MKRRNSIGEGGGLLGGEIGRRVIERGRETEEDDEEEYIRLGSMKRRKIGWKCGRYWF